MLINKYHGSYNRSRRSASIKYIVIHYTGGTGSARNNCVYFSGGNRNASADYFVDDSGIWEYNDPSSGYYTWAVGDGRGRYGITNSNSINVEVVNNGGPFSDKEIAHLCELVSYLMNKYGISADHVVRHYDASRKHCPLYYVNDSQWNALRQKVTNSKVSTVVVTPSNTTKSSSGGIAVDGYWGCDTTRAVQRALGTPVDGIVSGQNRASINAVNRGGLVSASWHIGSGGSLMVKAFQKKVSANPDGYFGPNTCRAAQRYFGTPVDGTVSGPSTMVKEIQRRINAGTF